MFLLVFFVVTPSARSKKYNRKRLGALPSPLIRSQRAACRRFGGAWGRGMPRPTATASWAALTLGLLHCSRPSGEPGASRSGLACYSAGMLTLSSSNRALTANGWQAMQFARELMLLRENTAGDMLRCLWRI